MKPALIAAALAASLIVTPVQAQTPAPSNPYLVNVPGISLPNVPAYLGLIGSIATFKPSVAAKPYSMAPSLPREQKVALMQAMMGMMPSMGIRDAMSFMSTKYKAKDGLTFDDVVQSMELRANTLNFKKVGHSPMWKDIQAVLGDKEAPRMEVFHYCDIAAGREVLKAATVSTPDAVITGRGEVVIQPDGQGDVELIYDLGAQNIGYWQLEVNAGAGTIIDIAGIEYINPQGKVQHTDRYRNDMRYICGEGDNQFTSLMRRSGRYLFLTFRNLERPAALRAVRLVESTYPVAPVGSFACSDERLNKIWEISARTLKLCMEDTFTDCPLYEQTHWVGDARNEALIGFSAFGAPDLARRCAKLTAYSLDHKPYVLGEDAGVPMEYLHALRNPLTISQTPSTWDIVIPVWSFLWTISTWDYYYYSGDVEFLTWVYPYVIRNLKSARAMTDERGLFSAPYWNMALL